MKYDYGLNLNENDSLYKIIQRINKFSTILEIGPATGRLTKFLKTEYGCKVHIVELDQEGFDQAVKYAEGGICGNIEDISILTKFRNINFDYVIFADVLEHLRDPEKVLSEIKKLFPHATVLCSVPNIAHNSIIIELLCNRFKYNPLGLLDNTHIHFFTYNSFAEMADVCGYKIKSQDNVVAKVGQNEIRNLYSDVDSSIVNALKIRDFANSYQFIFELVNTDELPNDFEAPPINNNFLNYDTQIYFGDVLMETKSRIFSISGNETELIIDLDTLDPTGEAFRYIRIDLINSKCIVCVDTISIDNKAVSFSQNHDIKFGNLYFFSNEPEFLVDLKENDFDRPKQLKIKFQIIKKDCDTELISLIRNQYNNLSYEFVNEEYDLEQTFNAVKDICDEYQDLMNELYIARNNYNSILNSWFWRITKPIRKFNGLMKKVVKSNRVTRAFAKGLLSLKRVGLKGTLKKINTRIKIKQSTKHNSNTFVLSKKEILLQRNTKFNKNIKFSILVPLYNTPEKLLREMIDSAINQTYTDWELCLADGSDDNYKFVEDICKNYVKNNSRIKYKKLEKNLGISDNTNECIKMSTGDYLVLFDHDDLLHPSALFENVKVINEQDADFIYTDEDKVTENGKKHFDAHFKPDFSIYNLRSNNYICHLTTFKKDLLDKSGMFNSEFNGSQDHDLVLRLAENAQKIVHIPKILYHWRVSDASVASDPYAKPYTINAGINAVKKHLNRMGIEAEVKSSKVHPNIYDIKYKIIGDPLVSIIIPTKDNITDLSKLLNSIIKKSTYENYEIIIVENNSTEKATFEYYDSLKPHEKIKVVTWNGIFNYSAINNFGFKHCLGEHIILLNNDTEIINSDWIQEMLMYSQLDGVGAVGAKLYYPDDTIQHAGVGIGLLTLAGHYFKGFDKSHPGYFGRMSFAQELSAVTAACMMIPRKVYEKVHGLDESFQVAFNDIDLCMRIRQAGYKIIWTPYAELYHFESKSRGEENTPQKRKRFEGEVKRFQNRWFKELEDGDPFYNPNLTLMKEDFSTRYY